MIIDLAYSSIIFSLGLTESIVYFLLRKIINYGIIAAIVLYWNTIVNSIELLILLNILEVQSLAGPMLQARYQIRQKSLIRERDWLRSFLIISARKG